MAEPLRQFCQPFAGLKPEPGAVVSLAPASRALSADTRLLCLPEFLLEAVNQGVGS
jgi:hypothetical protein